MSPNPSLCIFILMDNKIEHLWDFFQFILIIIEPCGYKWALLYRSFLFACTVFARKKKRNIYLLTHTEAWIRGMYVWIRRGWFQAYLFIGWEPIYYLICQLLDSLNILYKWYDIFSCYFLNATELMRHKYIFGYF